MPSGMAAVRYNQTRPVLDRLREMSDYQQEWQRYRHLRTFFYFVARTILFFHRNHQSRKTHTFRNSLHSIRNPVSILWSSVQSFSLPLVWKYFLR